MARSRIQGSKWDYLSPEHLEFVPGLLVVRIKQDVVANVAQAQAREMMAGTASEPGVRTGAAGWRRAFALPQAIDEPFRDLLRKKKLQQIVPVFAPWTTIRGMMKAAVPSASASFASSVWDSESEDLCGINLVRLSDSANAASVEKELRGTRGIEYVHRVPTRWPAAASNNPMVSRQWGLRAIRWFDPAVDPDAHDVKVAVLDTGIDLTHPDLSSIGAKYTYDGTSAEDIVGHGTHVSGIIAADFQNNIGVAGICRCSLHVWKIFGDKPASDGKYYVDELMYQRALSAARIAKMRTLNLSIGGTRSSQTERLLFRSLADAGVVVIAAMGNDYLRGNPIEYPAKYPEVIAVGASDENDRRAPFSNTGPHIALCAPGTNIFSCLPMKKSSNRTATGYAAWSGTSMATPHVTAAATLAIAKNDAIVPADLTSLLRRTATKMAGKRNEIGAGLLNLARVLS